MIVVRISEGLGNQLFQYAMGRATALRHRTQLKLDLRWFAGNQGGAGRVPPRRKYGLDAFNIRAKPATTRELAFYAPRSRGICRYVDKLLRKGSSRIAPQVSEPTLAYSPHYTKRADAYLRGFWQSEKYFADFADLLRQEFRLRDSAAVRHAQEKVRLWRDDSVELCGVHVRRGELLPPHEGGPAKRQYGPPTSLAYLHRAMDMFPPSCRFVVVTEPLERAWCKKNVIDPRVVHFDGENEIADFAMLQSCDHNIIANSTFSWWAAWLNDNPGRRVIAPAPWGWPDEEPWMVNNDLIPATWTVIDGTAT